jgi:hypothetical protein
MKAAKVRSGRQIHTRYCTAGASATLGDGVHLFFGCGGEAQRAHGLQHLRLDAQSAGERVEGTRNA